MKLRNARSSDTDDALVDGPGQSTGWAKIETTFRRFDRAKINDCKEDIDTLLVFAGLFSAVLSAFVLVSYQDLKEDYFEVSVQILERMSQQAASYTIASGFMNSTVPPYTRIPFQPSSTAILVNVLWFSSLILCLSTASFGILVKQWLHEYLAGEFVSPQAHLRVRHFRLPGLANWKVFEIAAILPLLLQISLGLFFYGLCLFTADAHKSVGWATFAIVIGWLIFFTFAVLAPLVSDRYPYKTTALKRALSFIRRRILIAIYANDKLPQREEDVHTSDTEDDKILLAVDRVLLDDLFLMNTVWDSFEQLRLSPERVSSFVINILSHRIPGFDGVDTDITSLRTDLETLRSSLMSWVVEAFSDTLMRVVRKSSANDDEVNWIWDRGILNILYAAPYNTLTTDVISSLHTFILRFPLDTLPPTPFICSILSLARMVPDMFARDKTIASPTTFQPSVLAQRDLLVLLEHLQDNQASFSAVELETCVGNLLASHVIPSRNQEARKKLLAIDAAT